MTYNFTCQVLNNSTIKLIRQDENGKEGESTYAMKDFFECAQFLGLFPGGTEFNDEWCIVQFEKTHGGSGRKTREYADLLNGLAFGDDDIQEIGARLFQDELPQTIYWVCPMSTVVQKLELKGYFNGPLFQEDLLEYTGEAGLKRLIFKNEIGGQTFFTDEFEAKKRLQLNLQTTLMLLNRELIEHVR